MCGTTQVAGDDPRWWQEGQHRSRCRGLRNPALGEISVELALIDAGRIVGGLPVAQKDQPRAFAHTVTSTQTIDESRAMLGQSFQSRSNS